MVQTLFDRLLPSSTGQSSGQGANGQTLEALLVENGFDRVQHEQIRADVRAGRIGLAQNRLPANSDIRDVQPGDVFDATAVDALSSAGDQRRATGWRDLGLAALASGAVAVVSLAGGVGSRWTQGAGVVKALHPFCRLGGRHRTFIEVHLAKSRRIGRLAGRPLPHVITTSYSDPRADRSLPGRRGGSRGASLRLRGAALPFTRPDRGAAHDPDGARSAFCVGGNAPATAGRAGAEGARQPAARPDRLGAGGR